MNKIIKLFILLCFLSFSYGYAQNEYGDSDPVEYIYSITPSDSLKAYVFAPQKEGKKNNRPAIVIFHGGGWSMGSPAWAFERAREFADKGLIAIAAEYRLSDQKTITPVDAMKDARDVIIWMRKNSKKLHIKTDSIAAYGWSAGAHLAASTAVFPSTDDESGYTSVPNALILYSPALWPCKDGWFKKLLMNKGNPCQYAPAEHLEGKMPPSVIVVGQDDTVTPLEQSRKYHQKMLKFGNESYLHVYKNAGHLFTPSSQPDSGRPNPDKEIVKKVDNDILNFLQNLGYIH